ncbi:HD domain-containing protein [Nitriliruptoria bacterium AS10]|nr:HD domain-containing protein [Salsipaludibacter albus]
MIARDRAARIAWEHEWLSPAATTSDRSRGREHPEEPHPFRTAFERDRDRILHSKAFRRLKHKTQVFLNPEGDHFVTRLTHTLAVAQVGRAIAVGLGLNEPLTEAICLGHDLGHSPFGHTGEEALSPYMVTLGAPLGEWQHAVQSLRIVDKLEPLNLTFETRDGIRGSSWRNDPPPRTAEGMACRFADRIAYLAHDAEDAMRAGVLTVDMVPDHVLAVFGEPGNWIDAMTTDLVVASSEAGEITMHDRQLQAFHDLRAFMFADVYLRDESRDHNVKAIRLIRGLVDHFAEQPDEIPPGYASPDDHPLQQAVDYVAGMSDSYALATHDRLHRPRGLY